MSIQQIAVIGAGTMGRGIAETAAVSGLQVAIVEVNARQREIATAAMQTSVAKSIQKGKIAAKTPEEVLQRITWHEDLTAAGTADYVIEAVPEEESLKRKVLVDLDGICRPETILATNTSSISVTRLAMATKRPDAVVGLHFFNPVPIMPPVEIVRGLATSDETITVTKALAERMGKQALVVTDSPGFVVNRILMPLINEAAFTLQEGVADAATIDSLMKLGCNHPMGPLQLADFIGIDVVLSILHVLHREFGDPKFRPCPLIARLVDAGRLGKKTGSGFHTY
jgi:3-hydroxybutyryl-CoA dehydrogenase